MIPTGCDRPLQAVYRRRTTCCGWHSPMTRHSTPHQEPRPLVSLDRESVQKVGHNEHVWRRVKYDDISTRSFTDGAALHTAVDDALATYATAHQNPTHHLLQAA